MSWTNKSPMWVRMVTKWEDEMHLVMEKQEMSNSKELKNGNNAHGVSI